MRPGDSESQKLARVDFHLHSYASNVTDYYASNALAMPESYSDPVETYHLLKSRGMDLVTLTDHNSIDGVKELLDAGLPDVFISAEMTAVFPEDDCRIHVTVANMSESEFAEVDRLKENVYDMVDYVDRLIANEGSDPSGRRLAYFMTHPLMSTQNRPYGRFGALTAEHIEKAMLLFNCLETRNGTRAPSFNLLTARLLASLTPQTIERLANKHDIAPKGPTPWIKSVVGGSDDHSGINPGMTWTEFRYEGDLPTPNDVINSIRDHYSRPGGEHGGPVTLSHAVVKLLYDGQFSQHRTNDVKAVSMGGALNSLLAFAFAKESPSTKEAVSLKLRHWFRKNVKDKFNQRLGKAANFEDILVDQARELLLDKSFRDQLSRAARTDDKIFLVISSLLNRIFMSYMLRLKDWGSRDLITTIKEVIAMVSSNVFVSLPYFLCYSAQSADKYLLNDVRKAFRLQAEQNLVLVTDTLFDVNGVGKTIWKMIKEAKRRGLDFTVLACLGDDEIAQYADDENVIRLREEGRLKILPSIINMNVPEYEGLQIRVPPFLELLRYLQESGFTKMQISTPGPVGLLGLLAAKILQLETSSTYHTSFPEYVERYTGDVSLEALTWRYMIMFYHAVDEVVVPSRFIAKLLHERGLRNRNILILDRWVDLRRFHPSHKTPGFWSQFGVENEEELVKFLYLGRLGAEKNLDTLAEAYLRVRKTHPNAHLVVIGDGPYKEQLVKDLRGAPVTFTGFLGGEDLVKAVASADAKLFPSTTDTWGNAPLEAQASGLPVVVSDQGGPQELMRDGETGYRVKGGDVEDLAAAMVELMNPLRRRTMGENARHFVEVKRVDEPFSAILDADAYRARRKEKREEKRSRENEGRSDSGSNKVAHSA